MTQAVNVPLANTIVKNFEAINILRSGSGDDTFTLGTAAYAFTDDSSLIYAGAGTDTMVVDYTNLTYGNSGMYNEANRIRSRANNASFLYFEEIENFNITGSKFDDVI